MGFRDINLFNQALLAKQAWRILQDPECLFARLMKSRYFETSDFLNASMGVRPSFGWRSIMHGRALLSQGISKKVGNGKSLKVWTDPWIEDDGFRAPWRKNYFFDVNLRVADLLDIRKRDWDLLKLKENFFPEDIHRIRKIKPVMLQNDFYIWKHNRSGDFSVKSAYWLASQNNSNPSLVEASMCPSVNILKQQVWELQTDPKLKIFLWKVLSGALPVADALNDRGVVMDRRCQICDSGDESINHILFSCSLSRQIWALSNYPIPELNFHEGSVYSNMQHLLRNRSNLAWPKELRMSFPWILWRIWTNRNLTIFEGKSFSSLEMVEKIKEDVKEWVEAQEVVSDGEGNGEGCTPSQSNLSFKECENDWYAPPINWLKCNIGISWAKRNRQAGGAWVVRDPNGMVLIHSRRSFANVTDKLDAQFKVLIWAIESMKSHKFINVIFAFQGIELIGAVTRPKAWPSFRYYSSEVNERLKAFVKWELLKESDRSNRGANLIAQSATQDFRFQSYVAAGHPRWLGVVFEDERVLASELRV